MYQDWLIWGQSPFVSAAVEFQIGHKIIGDFLFDLDGFLFELSTIVFFLDLASNFGQFLTASRLVGMRELLSHHVPELGDLRTKPVRQCYC